MPRMLFLIALFTTPGVHAQSSPDPIEAQRASVLRMQESIRRQVESVHRQTGQSRSDGFFVLPPQTPRKVPSAAAGCDMLPLPLVGRLAEDAAARERLDSRLVLAVMRVESGFRPCAISPKGAIGLMQLMPETARELGVIDPLDPRQNVNGGARYLRQLIERYRGDLNRALGAYNAGAGRVDGAGGIPPIPETVSYVGRVLQLLPPNP